MFKHIRINGESRIVFEFGKNVEFMPYRPFLIASAMYLEIR